jgi:hypothetical protein
MPVVPTAILLGCVKTKLEHPAQAQDLYCSPLWRDRRGYAEASGLRWLILSANYGLAEPHTPMHPYDLALDALSAQEQRIWGERVTDALEWRCGPLKGAMFEAMRVSRTGRPSRRR